MNEEIELEPPAVNLSLDASMSMAAVRPEEQSDKGLHDAVKRLQAMCQISIALGTIVESSVLMEKIIDFIFEIFPHAERTFIMLKDKDNNNLVPIAARRKNKNIADEEIAISKSIINEVVKNKRSILSNDAMTDDRFSSQMSIVNFSIRSMICAPLLVDEKILGLIQVDTASVIQSFTEEDLQILTGISTQAAVAVKNMQLYAEIETETSRRVNLQRYFSPNMVDMLMAGKLDTKLGGKKYRGTIFFSDIIGFTRMSETMPPEKVVKNLNRYFTIMQKHIYNNGGNVDKFAGDAIMAFWSVPQHIKGDEERAILTGLQMQNSQWVFNHTLKSEGEQPIFMGIGINTGDFVAGNVGSEEKIEFTLIGDNVNLASRIESNAGRGQIFIASSTYDIVKNSVIAIKLPPVTLKGKSKPEVIYSIRGIEIQNGESILSFPCDVLNEKGEEIANGIITAIIGTGTEKKIVFTSNKQLSIGDTIGLRLIITELNSPAGCFGFIENSTMVNGDKKDCPYCRIVLGKIKETSNATILEKGTCMNSGLNWESLKRL